MLVEAVFVRPGLGQVLVAAVEQQDMPVVIGVTMLIALVYVIANLIVDITYVLVDPRLRKAGDRMSTVTEVIGTTTAAARPAQRPHSSSGSGALDRVHRGACDRGGGTGAAHDVLDRLRINLHEALKAPSWRIVRHRPVGPRPLTRVIYGARAVASDRRSARPPSAMVLAIILGLTRRPRPADAVDGVISRGLEVLFAFPVLLLALLFVAIYGPGVTTEIVAVGDRLGPRLRTHGPRPGARRARLRLRRGRASARALPLARSCGRHIFPNAMRPLVV